MFLQRFPVADLSSKDWRLMFNMAYSFQNQNIDNIGFMKLVEQHKCLYVSSEKDQKSREAKDNAWKAIGKQIGNHISTDELIRRYKNIRTSFGRFLRENTKNATDEVKLHGIIENSSWSYLAWLQPYIKHKSDTVFRPPVLPFGSLINSNNFSFNNVDKDTAEHITLGATNDCFDQNKTPSYNPSECEHDYQIIKEENQRLKPEDSSVSLDPNVVVQTFNTLMGHFEKDSNRKRPWEEDIDEDVLFLKSLIPQLKRIPSSLKFAVKTNILKILHDGEFGATSD